MGAIDLYEAWLARQLAGSVFTRSKLLYRASRAFPDALRFFQGREPTQTLNLFEGDDLLGWRLRPNVDTRHPSFDHEARYVTDELGRRRVHGSGAGPALYFLGCSFTFGFHIDAGQEFASLLADEFRVENLAVPGYGTVHQYLMLTRTGLLERAKQSGGCVIYCWNPIHMVRVWRRRWWLEHLERGSPMARDTYRGNPLVDIENGKLVHRGLARSSDSVDDRDPYLDDMEWRITCEVLDAMQAAASGAGVRFIVAALPSFWDVDPTRLELKNRLMRRLPRAGIEALDIYRPGTEPQAFFPYSQYPTPLGHRLLAERFRVELRQRLLGG